MIDIPENDPNIDHCYNISAGKYRRYHGQGWRQFTDINTLYLNLKDILRTIRGFWQSWQLLGVLKPNLIFTRGGFVSVPVALAAKLRGIPYITHDSDSTPSLANRIIAPWAAIHAVALDPLDYPYPKHKTYQVGVPIESTYRHVNAKQMQKYRLELNLQNYKWVICVTGGGNGAKQLNQIVLDNAQYLLTRYPELAIIHIAGRELASELEQDYTQQLSSVDLKRVIVKDFVHDLYKYSGASDIVIARGGATNLAEFSAQAKTCIVIPSKQLIWNVKNARSLAANNAIIELSEEHAAQERRLAMLISDLLDHEEKRSTLAKKFAQYSSPNATAKLVELILGIADK